MIKQRFTLVTCMLIMMIFVYAAVSKLIDFDRFKIEIYNQVFSEAQSLFLIRTLPAAELVAGILLAFKASRIAGLVLATGMLLCFTGYTAAVFFHFFPRVPCSCGGIFRSMNWAFHFMVNLLLTVMAFIAITLEMKAVQRIQKI